MECPYCGKTESKVVDSRLAEDGITIRRRRQCLTCSDRFTTYESTQEHLLPFLIVKNTGPTIPNLRTMLSIVSSTLTTLSEETEKLIDKVDKVEKTQVAKQSKRAAASKKKAPAKKKSRSLTSIDRHIQPPEEDIFEEGLSLDEAVKDYEKRLILEALEKTNGVKAKAAKLLHINRTTLVEKIKSKNLTQTSSP